MKKFTFSDEDNKESKMIMFERMLNQTRSEMVKRGCNVYTYKQKTKQRIVYKAKRDNKILYKSESVIYDNYTQKLCNGKIIENYF